MGVCVLAYMCAYICICVVCTNLCLYRCIWESDRDVMVSPWGPALVRELQWQDMFLSLKMLVFQQWSICTDFSKDTCPPARVCRFFFVWLWLWTVIGLRVEGLILLLETILSKPHFELWGSLCFQSQPRQYGRFLPSHSLSGDSAHGVE